MNIKIKIDRKAVDHVLGRVTGKNVERVLNKGINAAAQSCKKQCVSEIYRKYNLKKKDINVGVRVRKAGLRDSSASVSIAAHPIALDRFSPRQVKMGLKVKVNRSGTAESIPSAFMQTVKGKRMALIRTQAIKGTAAKYVVKPSSRAPYRGRKGQALPINRLWVDPMSDVIVPIADQIADIASGEGTVKMLVELENILDRGK